MSTLTTTLFKFVGGVHQARAGLCFVLNYEIFFVQSMTVIKVEKERFCSSDFHSEISQLLRDAPRGEFWCLAPSSFWAIILVQ